MYVSNCQYKYGSRDLFEKYPLISNPLNKINVRFNTLSATQEDENNRKLSAPQEDENKRKLIIIFMIFSGASKRFYKGFKSHHKTFWCTTKKCEKKNLS